MCEAIPKRSLQQGAGVCTVSLEYLQSGSVLRAPPGEDVREVHFLSGRPTPF